MDELLDLIVTQVSAAGGVIEYPALLDAIPGQYRRWMPAAFAQLKQEGRVRKRIRVVDGRPVHEVYIP